MAFRSPLFILGIAAVPTATPSGVRSMLAFWAGGACAGVEAAVTPASSSGGGRPSGHYRPSYYDDRRDDYYERIIRDDEELVELLAIVITLM